MTNEFNKDVFLKMLESALAAVEANLDEFNKLDAATGDGDHGTAILATMKAALDSARQPGSLAETATNIAMGIMTATGGSTSSLNGAFYMGLADGAKSETLGPAEVVAMFDAGLTTMKTTTNAQVGDKTMMDAVLPAIDAMKATIAENPNATLCEVFSKAAEAAKAGADKTAEYVAKFGRARNLGERSKGTKDAGATSAAVVYKAFADAIANA